MYSPPSRRPHGDSALQPHPGHFRPAPSPATPPALYVLVAMGLMAILAGLFGTCGTIAALVLLDSGAQPVQAAMQPEPPR